MKFHIKRGINRLLSLFRLGDTLKVLAVRCFTRIAPFNSGHGSICTGKCGRLCLGRISRWS